MDLGFKQAGHETVAANEFWEPAVLTYRKNFPDSKMVAGDINLPDTKRSLIDACGGSCDILVGGPPCQAYSMAGKRDPNDPRGRLFESYVEMVSMTRPMVTVMENVSGILSMKHSDGKVVDLILARMAQAGYKVFYKTMDASLYGTPQRRVRVIFIGIRDDLPGSIKPVDLFPQMTHSDQSDWIIETKPYVTVKDAIGDLEGVPERREWNHVFTKHSPEYVAKIHKTRIGTSVTGYSEACFRCDPNKPSKTVKANNGGVFIHYSQDRCMSARELARLQGFPDEFIFLGSKGDVLKQIGNAVPPPLARAIAKMVSGVVSPG